MICVSRLLQEKCREQHQQLFFAFVDLTKAFDSVNREALWCLLRRFGCPQKFINIVRILHEDMTATILRVMAQSRPLSLSKLESSRAASLLPPYSPCT